MSTNHHLVYYVGVRQSKVVVTGKVTRCDGPLRRPTSSLHPLVWMKGQEVLHGVQGSGTEIYRDRNIRWSTVRRGVVDVSCPKS